jgi:hypothetical protein
LAALLPLLVLRLLIPVGFMPMADAGGLSIALCPGEGPRPPAMTHLQHLHHGGHHGDTSGGGEHHAPCLFAASAGAALAPAFLALALADVPAAGCAAPHTAIRSTPSICRAQSARAPPLTA